MRTLLTKTSSIEEKLDRVELTGIEHQALRFPQPAIELPVHVGLGADDGVSFVVAQHDRIRSAGEIAVNDARIHLPLHLLGVGITTGGAQCRAKNVLLVRKHARDFSGQNESLSRRSATRRRRRGQLARRA